MSSNREIQELARIVEHDHDFIDDFEDAVDVILLRLCDGFEMFGGLPQLSEYAEVLREERRRR